MKVACRRSGLTPHVLRVWEKRYQAVTPVRSASNRRGYTEDDIVRLQLLGTLTKLGHRIGQIAGLSRASLEELMAKEQGVAALAGGRLSEPAEVVDRAFAAVKEYDADLLFHLMEQALIQFGLSGVLQQVVGPLVTRIGAAWPSGELRVAHEHLASRVLRDFLASATRTLVARHDAPEILVATPQQQLHELGAMMVAAAAQNHGWRAMYLGPSLPAVEIAGAAVRRNQARAVALSIVYPETDPMVEIEIRTLARHLPERVALLAGGRAVEGYRGVLEEVGAEVLGGLDDLVRALDRLAKAERPEAGSVSPVATVVSGARRNSPG